MRILLTLIVLAISPLTTPLYAHSTKMGSMPKDGSTIVGAPSNLMIQFDRPARLTRVRMTHTNSGATHTDRLDVPNTMSDTITLSPDFRGPGVYEIEWRAMSDDGHPINGSFSFTVTGQ